MYLQTPSKTNGSHNLWKTTKASQKFVVHFLVPKPTKSWIIVSLLNN